MTDNESMKARIALAFNLNLGGIKDTFKSFKDGYKALKEVPNIGRVGSFIKDIVKGRSLLESLEGREKTINAMSTLFNGPSSGGVSAGIGLNVNISSAKNASEYLQHITTNIRAGQDILLKSKELETEGGFVRAENDLTIEAEKVKLLASADTYKMKGKNAGANFGVVIYGAEGYSAGMNYGEMKSEGRLYNNSHIQAGNKVSIKAEDMEIRGGRVEGRHTAVDVKSLVIESVQDKEELKQIGVSAGYSKQYGTHTDTQGNTTPDNKNNVNAGLSYGKRDKLWVKEQSGIVGTESADVNVKGKLTLIGSIIVNINEKGEDGGNLKLSYGEIETRDLEDYDKLLNLDGNMSLNQRSKGNNTELALDKKGNVKEVANRVDEEYGVGAEGHDRRRITRTTIGRGTVLGSVSESINRDIKKSQEIIKGVEVKRTEFRFKSEPNSWGDFNNIMSSNAGVLGNFLDDVNEGMLGKERTNHEGEFRDTVHKIISKIESPIDKANRFISLFPTSETHGGMLEQIVRTIRQDKIPIIKITVQRKEDGTSSINMEELKKISDYKPKDGGTVKVNTNGIIELKGQAARNTIFKNITKEDMAKYNRGEAIEYIMIYNPTRGAVSDLIESALGKMFDGSWSSLGLSIGVNRGAAVAYASIDKKQNYDFSFYSQGNIVGLGAFNILKNKGIRLGYGQESFKVRMYGTPIVKAGFERFENPLGIKVVGAAINEPDFIGSNGKWKGLVGERRPVLGVKTKDIERMKKNWKDSKVVANMPIIKSILREEPGGVLALPKLVSEEEKAKYKENPSKWLKENNYSMPITREQLNQIRGNYQEEVKDNLIAEGKGKLSDNWIMKKWLNDGHGAYTYYSAIYAGEIDKLLKDYVKANGVERLGIESEIERKYIENQEKLIELFTNGPAILNDSQGLREGVTEYNRRDFEKGYNQDRYIDKGLPSNYITNSMNEGIRKGKLGALDISEYIESLRNGAGLR